MIKNTVCNFASIGAVILLTFGPAQAGVVTSASDDVSLASLRGIINNAEKDEIITFDPSLNGKTITLTNGQLVLTKNVQIVGPGANLLKISGGGVSRVFNVANGVVAAISGLTIANGNGVTPIPTGAGAAGGVVLTNSGTNTLSGTTGVASGTLVLTPGTIPLGSPATTVDAVLTTNAGGFVNVGSGTLVLAGANTSGGSAAVDNGPFPVNTGTLPPPGAATTVNAVSTTTTGGLVTTGSGTAVLTGANPYTGSTTLAGATLALNSGIVSPTVANAITAVNPTGGTLAFGGVASGLSNAATVTFNGATNTVGGTLAVTGGSIVIANPGTGFLISGTAGATNVISPTAGASTGSGLAGIGGATLVLTNTGTNTLSSGTVLLTGGTLQLGGVSTSAGGSIVIVGPPAGVTPLPPIAFPPLNVNSPIGGAILNNGGTLTVRDCVLTANSAAAGGAIGNDHGNLTLIKSRLFGNQASGFPIFGGYDLSAAAAVDNNGGTVTVSDSVISANVAKIANFVGSGSTIKNFAGHLTVINSTISGNQAGGIFSDGGVGSFLQHTTTLRVINATISGNVGGGIFNSDGDCTVTDSSVSENTGGGIGNVSLGAGLPPPYGTVGTFTLTNCTIAGNTAGGIVNGFGGVLTVRNCTIAGNTANTNAVGGSGIYNAAGHLTLSNTILAKNRGNLIGVGLSVVSLGYNLSDDSSAAGLLNGPGDLNNTSAGLDLNAQGDPRLQDNGGMTKTIALLPGSAAIDKGDPAFNPNPPLPSDQRGFPRVANGRVDIGALETQTPRSLTIAVQRALQAIPATTDPTGRALRAALESLTMSLQPVFWVDDTHLTVWGHWVFNADRFAVEALTRVVNAHGPIERDAQDWIDYLVEADEVLAKIAIRDAAAGDPKKLAEANRELAAGELALSQDKSREAIEHFAQAWHQAQQALRKIPRVPAGS